MQTECTAGPHCQYLIVTKLFGFESIVVVILSELGIKEFLQNNSISHLNFASLSKA